VKKSQRPKVTFEEFEEIKRQEGEDAAATAGRSV